MKIEFYVNGPKAVEVVAAFLPEYTKAVLADAAESYNRPVDAVGVQANVVSSVAREQADDGEATRSEKEHVPVAGAIEFRVYGQSSPGKARRTKDEMVEDDKINARASKLGVAIDTTRPASDVLADLEARLAGAEGKANISTGEDRVDPTENDIFDDAGSDDEKPVTKDDVRKLMNDYVDKFGMERAQEDVPGLIGYPKISKLPDEPGPCAKAAAALIEALKADA